MIINTWVTCRSCGKPYRDHRTTPDQSKTCPACLKGRLFAACKKGA